MTEPRFDERQTAEILRRAAEIERARREDAGTKLSSADIQKIATESGLDPVAVRQALAETAGGPPKASEAELAQEGRRLRFVRRLPGRLGESASRALLEPVGRELGSRGDVDREGRTLSWWSGRPRRVGVHVVPRREDTRLEVNEDLAPLRRESRSLALRIGMVGSFLALPIGMGQLESWAATLALVGLSVVGALFFSRGSYGKERRRRARELRDLADRLEAEGVHALADGGEETAAERSAGRDDEEDERDDDRDDDNREDDERDDDDWDDDDDDESWRRRHRSRRREPEERSRSRSRRRAR